MKKHSLFTILSLAIGAVLTATTVARANEIIPGEYLVKYRDNAFVSMWSLQATPSVRLMDHNPVGHLFKVKLRPSEEPELLARLLASGNIEYIVPNIKLRAFTAPETTMKLREQWAIKKVHAEEAWERAGNKGSRNVVVAVIDTGMDYKHESLKENAVSGYDFKENDSDPYDVTGSRNPGHGTHCAGIIGGTGLVDGGVVGISPEVSIMPLRFLGEDGSGDLNAGIKAIDYAIEKGVQVISASWGATIKRSQAMPLVEAVKRADDAGVIFVVAAANDGRNNDQTEVYPANAGFPNTIAVAASGPNDEKPQWSNYGKRTVHLASPGLNIMSTLPNNKYGNLSGTSMATPLVSGLVAFLKAQDSSLTGSQVRALLQLTGQQVSIETACNCRVDALSAVDYLLKKQMFIYPAAATLAVGEKLKFAAKNAEGGLNYKLANANVGTIDQDGNFTAGAAGDTTITVTDANGHSSTSLPIHVGQSSGNEPPDEGGGPGNCPLGDEALCKIICQIQPDLPFCNQ